MVQFYYICPNYKFYYDSYECVSTLTVQNLISPAINKVVKEPVKVVEHLIGILLAVLFLKGCQG